MGALNLPRARGDGRSPPHSVDLGTVTAPPGASLNALRKAPSTVKRMGQVFQLDLSNPNAAERGGLTIKRLSCKEQLDGWGKNANCYAYACNCLNPDVGDPPRQAGPGIRSGRIPPSDADVSALVAGVIADSGGRARRHDGDPSMIPMPPPGSYLVALLTNSAGFHFIRRDENTQRWSWKDGNEGKVQLNVMHLPSRQYVYINNSNLNDLLVTHKDDYGWMYSQMNFQAFLSIPDGGISVAGVTPTNADESNAQLSVPGASG